MINLKKNRIKAIDYLKSRNITAETWKHDGSEGFIASLMEDFMEKCCLIDEKENSKEIGDIFAKRIDSVKMGKTADWLNEHKNDIEIVAISEDSNGYSIFYRWKIVAIANSKINTIFAKNW